MIGFSAGWSLRHKNSLQISIWDFCLLNFYSSIQLAFQRTSQSRTSFYLSNLQLHDIHNSNSLWIVRRFTFQFKSSFWDWELMALVGKKAYHSFALALTQCFRNSGLIKQETLQTCFQMHANCHVQRWLDQLSAAVSFRNWIKGRSCSKIESSILQRSALEPENTTIMELLAVQRLSSREEFKQSQNDLLLSYDRTDHCNG